MGNKTEWRIFEGHRPGYPIPRTVLLQPKGIDLLNRHDASGFLYEETVYNYIYDNLDGLVIGPHLLDQIFLTVPHQTCKPDALVFQQQTEGYVLSHLIEAKSGLRICSNHKLEGFTRFLAWLRLDPQQIHRKITRFKSYSTNPDHQYWPNLADVIVPEDNDIHVVFISPHESHGSLYIIGNSFASVTHQLVT